VGAWADKWGEAEVGVADLFSIALTVEGIDLGKGSERSQRATFGKALSQQRDRVIGEYRIVQTRKVQRLQRWRLIQARPGGNPFEAFYAAQDPGQDEGLPDVEEEYDPWTQ